MTTSSSGLTSQIIFDDEIDVNLNKKPISVPSPSPYWGEWKPWSDCTHKCYGTQYRTRGVWHHNVPECNSFEACATPDMGWDRQVCNKVCYNGGVYSPGYPCRCRPGSKGRCCDTGNTDKF